MKPIHIGTQPLETARLQLRAFRLEDAQDMFMNWMNDKEVQSNYGEPVYETISSVQEIVRQWISSYSHDDFYRWAILLKETNQVMGQIAFCEVNRNHHYADLEYCIGARFQGKGYATEAVDAVIRYTFEKTGLNRLQAFHRGNNLPSGSVLRKSMLRYEGTLRESFFYPDQKAYDDRVYYALVKSDYHTMAEKDESGR
ncbi:GNAT family N-acetyltransferase [Gorillibacterium sp. CAU 1737]|uniref:GNAT family N-acetyltransferase n=1 Tax=Gorillibacterium sp. CAU 1737 TaxID=3140362 RepID=UPI00326138B9